LVFMDAVGLTDQFTVSLWQKNEATPDSSSFWFVAGGFDRAAQAHIPWSDGVIYFDTAGGCCAPGSQRLNFRPEEQEGLEDFDYLDGWHHYAFLKDGELKQVWIDGILAFETEGGASMPEENYTDLFIGSINAGGGSVAAVIDDFAVFGTPLGAEEILDLANGGTPGGGGRGVPFQITSVVPAEDGTVAVTWDSKAGRSYAIDFTAELPNWIEGADGLPSEGESTTYIDDAVPAGTETRYYRIREE